MNNREIKFRAYDKDIHEMYYLGDAIKEELVAYFYGSNLLQSQYESVILMQYTGLRDKNGKEIWEGDILKSPAGNNFIVEYWENGFYLNDITKTQFDESYEVIGNIYDNPELLK